MRYLSVVLLLVFSLNSSFAQDLSLTTPNENLRQDTMVEERFFGPMSVRLNLLGILWPYTNKIHGGYEHRISRNASASILLEYGFFQDFRRDFDPDIREQYIFYMHGYGITGELRFYIRESQKLVNYFIAPYLKFVSCKNIRERYLIGTLIEYKSTPAILYGGGFSGGMRVNLFQNCIYTELLVGLGGGYDSDVTWIDFDDIFLLSRFELSIGFNFRN